MASKSGKLTSEHFKTWMEKVFFPNVGSNSILLIDSSSGHCPKFVREATPLNKNVIPIIIPKGTTGKIQPLDVFGFRVSKNLVRRFSDSVQMSSWDPPTKYSRCVFRATSKQQKSFVIDSFLRYWKHIIQKIYIMLTNLDFNENICQTKLS